MRCVYMEGREKGNTSYEMGKDCEETRQAGRGM